jgi:hypothetical protein
VDDSIPHIRLAGKDNRRRGSAQRNIASISPSAQETKDGLNKENKQRDNEDGDPEGEEG